MSDLKSQIGGLSTAEKFELLDALWESLEAEAPAPTNEQGAELDRRVANYRQNPSNVISWEQVRAAII
jgi:putative addiction module component (TIGR02574 family)